MTQKCRKVKFKTPEGDNGAASMKLSGNCSEVEPNLSGPLKYFMIEHVPYDIYCTMSINALKSLSKIKIKCI